MLDMEIILPAHPYVDIVPLFLLFGLSVAAAIFAITLVSLMYAINDPHPSILSIASHVVVLIVTAGIGVGFSGGLSGDSPHQETLTDLADQAEFYHGVTELAPVNDPIGSCRHGDEPDSADYMWMDKEGNLVRGAIHKTSEVDGACTFTISAQE